jgi:hypothetical protein
MFIHGKAVAKKVVIADMNIVTANRGERIAIMKKAHKATNYVKQQQMMFELFMEDPTSDECKTF